MAFPAIFLLALFVQNPPPRDPLQTRIVLSDGAGNAVARTRRELGFRLASDAPVRFDIDGAALQAALRRIGPAFAAASEPARPVWKAGAIAILPGAHSRSLDAAQTGRRLADAVRADSATVRLTVSLLKKPPALSAEKLAGVTGILARFTTKTSDVAKRNRNIEIAARSIDGTLLSPGETFSLNKTVGERTQARGFRTATVFVDGEKAPGVGGGVSQVTGTLFNAAALAGLRIDEVHPHSRPVSYLPLGRDATVAFGAKDLKFTNATKAPVYLEFTFVGRTLQATVWGAPQKGSKIALTPRVRRRGAGRIDASLYRTVSQNGKVVRKERLFRHAYRWKAAD